MRTDHEELCGTSYGSFCLNGGICYMIPTVPSPFCRCIENYTGARCEEVLLPSIKSQTKGDLFAVLLASLLLLGVLLIGTFYFLCRKATIARTSSSECGAHLVETTSSNGCNKISLMRNPTFSFMEDRCQEFYPSCPSLKQTNMQPDVLVRQDYVTWAKRGQVRWSVSLSSLMTQREWLGTERHRKHELNSPTFITFLPLEVVTRKNSMYLYSSTSPSSSLRGVYDVVLKEKLEKISGSEGEKSAECRFLISEIKEKKVCKNEGGKKDVNKCQLLRCVLHALPSEKIVCILHTCRCKYSKTKKKRPSVTVHTVRSQGGNHKITTIRTQQRKMYYLLRTHVKEAGVRVKAQHLQENIQSTRDPEPEVFQLDKA